MSQEVGNRYGNFSLATMFPRREFTSEDLNKTLLELELVPSASIVLLPVSPRYTQSTSHLTELSLNNTNRPVHATNTGTFLSHWF